MNFLGCSHRANDGRDALDLSEPPPVGSYVSLYFPHSDRAGRSDHVTTDFRSPLGRQGTWEFVVETNITGSAVELSWKNISSLPPGYGLQLYDPHESKVFDLRERDGYRFVCDEPRTFTLTVDLARTAQDRNGARPGGFRLHQNRPNPFNPVTSIGFEMARASHVKIGIYNVEGKEVRILCDGSRAAGQHRVSFDARGLAAGVYFCRMLADGFSDTKKMVLLR
jgi:hypothetical protein